MKELRNCSRTLGNTGVDQSAYYRGMSHLKGIDFGKFRKQATDQLTRDQEAEDRKPESK